MTEEQRTKILAALHHVYPALRFVDGGRTVWAEFPSGEVLGYLGWTNASLMLRWVIGESQQDADRILKLALTP